MRSTTPHQIQLNGRLIDYTLVRSARARRLRVKVGPDGVEVVVPARRSSKDVPEFLGRNAEWLLAQLARAEALRAVREKQTRVGELLFRGEPTRVRVEDTESHSRCNSVAFVDGEIVVRRGTGSVSLARSLENWLREQARTEIENQVAPVLGRLRRKIGRTYIMDQRTRWGSCSGKGNLSFNWRLILAPAFVLRYLVVHEAAHIVVPNHSAQFWLTVQGLCSETETAKRWLKAHEMELRVDLRSVLDLGTEQRRRTGQRNRAVP